MEIDLGSRACGGIRPQVVSVEKAPPSEGKSVPLQAHTCTSTTVVLDAQPWETLLRNRASGQLR